MKSLQLQVPLSLHTTFRLGGRADYFISVSSIEELTEALNFARTKQIPWFILGEGSNVLVSDEGFTGMVIQMRIRGVMWRELSGDKWEVSMSAGEHWDDVVGLTVDRGLSGFEHLSGIPGTCGAAPVQNIGAYGAEIRDTLTYVEALDTRTLISRRFSVQECALGYRDSFFKTEEGKHFIITRVVCELSVSNTSDISYKDLAVYFKDRKKTTPSPREVREAVLAIRKAKLPDLAVCGTAGSFFKNPILTSNQYDILKEMFPLMPSFDMGNGSKKIPAAWMLDALCSFKGFRMGAVGVHQHQPLVLVHFGGGTSRELLSLADMMSACVKKHTHINLVPEVVMLGF